MRSNDDRIHRSTLKTTTTYTVNGVRYDRLEDVPAEFRKLFEDKDDNGVPDIVDSMASGLKSDPNAKVTTVRVEMRTSGTLGDIQRIMKRDLVRGDPQVRRIKCYQCGHDLSGATVGGTCPECGATVNSTIVSMSNPATSTRVYSEGSWLDDSSAPNRQSTRIVVIVCGIALVVATYLIVKFIF